MPIKKGSGRRGLQVTVSLDPKDIEYLDRRSGNDSRSRVAREIIRAAREQDEQARQGAEA